MAKRATLFTYDMLKKKSKERTSIQRQLYGFTDYSHSGQYTYQRQGLLTNILYLNPTQSCIIVKEQDARIIREFFEKYKIKFDERKVLLTEKEFKKLSG